MVGANPVRIGDGAGVAFRITNGDPAPVDLGIFDVTGRLIAEPLRRQTVTGETTVRWDGRDRSGARVDAGSYYFRASAGPRVETGHVVILPQSAFRFRAGRSRSARFLVGTLSRVASAPRCIIGLGPPGCHPHERRSQNMTLRRRLERGCGIPIVLATLGFLLLATRPGRAGTDDPLFPMLVRMNTYFHQHEVDGVTLDSRYDLAPSEVIRLSVVSQLLGYEELYRAYRRKSFRRDIVERADYLVDRFDDVGSPASPFEGMLGLALLEADQAVGDPRYRAKGEIVIGRLEALPPRKRCSTAG